MTTLQNPNLVGTHQPEGRDIRIPAGDAELTAYVARSAGISAAPGVIVIHENRGLVPYLRDVADGLASAGYVTAAPDLLSRNGGTGAHAASGKDILTMLREIPRERLVGDEAVPNILAAVLAVYGELDDRINQGVGAIAGAMQKAGKALDWKVYANAGHAFHNRTNPPDRYKAKAAKQAWTDALAWFDRYLRR